MAATSAPRLLTDDELWNTDYVNKQYVSSLRSRLVILGRSQTDSQTYAGVRPCSGSLRHRANRR